MNNTDTTDTPPKRKCATCFFCWGGQCRRFPPTPVPIKLTSGGTEILTIWPTPDHTDWCGEYK